MAIDTAPIDSADRAALDALTARISALDVRPLTEDAIAFGVHTWVYCNQHRNVHQTGWCTVSPRDKLGLGVQTAAAQEKCRDFGLALHHDRTPA